MAFSKSNLVRLFKFANLPSADQMLLVRAWVVVAIVRIALWVMPFKLLCDLMRQASRPWRKSNRISPARIIDAIELTARCMPGATCLTQALAGRMLLTRAGFPVILRIGVLKTDARLKAHAWLEHEGRIILGGNVPGIAQFKPLAEFDISRA